MEFAVVDIETTGGLPHLSAITEISAIITDGSRTIKRFETLLNPGMAIPRGITALTGINDAMVRDAPSFAEVAEELHFMLHDKIFVAHNVNFDLGFIRAAFRKHGMEFSPPKLCTVKLARRAFPGKRSYSLGNICSSLDITIQNRHRAGGDAEATVQLFSKIAAQTGLDELHTLAKKSIRSIVIPANVDMEEIRRLPQRPGVYYFLGRDGKPLYIGKANNLKKRVQQHFDQTRGKAAFHLEHIAHIDFSETGNELMALLTEAAEIHKYWPPWNVSLKIPPTKYSLVSYRAQNKELRMQVMRKARNQMGNILFHRMSEARNTMYYLVRVLGICETLVHANQTCNNTDCYCKWSEKRRRSKHNTLIEQAMQWFEREMEECLIIGPGRSEDEHSVIHTRDGRVMGWTHGPRGQSKEEILAGISPIADISVTKSIVQNFMRNQETYPDLDFEIILLDNPKNK